MRFALWDSLLARLQACKPVGLPESPGQPWIIKIIIPYAFPQPACAISCLDGVSSEPNCE
jgi:hypothetical protein